MFKEMSKILKEGQVGNFVLEKFELTGKEFRCDIPKGKYIRLIDKEQGWNGCVMSDTPMEKETNREFVEKAHGDILIAGLGIGLILLPLLEKKDVKKITIIEKNKEVIELIEHQLPKNSKITIINRDIFKNQFKTEKFDCIYFDIWNYINSDVYKEMKSLKRKYKKNLNIENPNNYIKCWAEYEAKHNLRL